MKSPFTNLEIINELIKLRKMGYRQDEMAKYFDTTKKNITDTLRLYFNTDQKGVPRNRCGLYGKYTDDNSNSEFVTMGVGYSKQIEEKVNPGKNYKEYLKEQGIKVKTLRYS